LAKYDKQWPAIDLVRQYLENSASYRTKKVTHSNTMDIRTLVIFMISQATVTLKKRLAATERTTSHVRNNGKRGESSTVTPINFDRELTDADCPFRTTLM